MKKKEDFITVDNDLLAHLLCTENIDSTNKRNYDELECELRTALDRCVNIRDYLKEL